MVVCNQDCLGQSTFDAFASISVAFILSKQRPWDNFRNIDSTTIYKTVLYLQLEPHTQDDIRHIENRPW